KRRSTSPTSTASTSPGRTSSGPARASAPSTAAPPSPRSPSRSSPSTPRPSNSTTPEATTMPITAMKRDLMTAEHEDLRESFGRFLDAEVVPHYERWEREGRIPREVLRRVGELGFLGFGVPETFGGPGTD